ncbi:MAG TPA: glycosyltransferase family 39 protein, partial [Polyangia bacterium]
RIAGGDLTFGGVFFRAPLYYYLLGALYRLFGVDPVVARVFQIAISAASTLLIYRLARTTFHAGVAVIAGGLACVYGMYVYFANELLIETLALFLNLVALNLFLRALEGARAWRWGAAGVGFGLAAITQPNVLVFVALALAWSFASLRHSWGGAPTVRCVGACVAGLALMIAPVTAYNAIVGGDRVLISSQGGVNLYIGNNPEANGVSAYVPGARLDWNGFIEDTNRLAKAGLGDPDAKPSAISRYWSGKAIDFMVSEPRHFLWLTARKVYFFFNAYEAANNRSLRPMTDFSLLFSYATARFWFVFPLAIAGVYLARGHARHLRWLLLFLVAQAGSFILFFVNARFRLSITPVVIVLAAFALWRLGRARRLVWRDARLRKALLLAVVVALAIFPHPRLQSEERWRGQLNYAAVLSKRKQFAEAAAVLEAAKSLKTTEPDAHVMLGRLYMDELRDPEKSLANFRGALVIAPNNADVVSDAGTAHFLAGKCDEAVPLLVRAIRLDDQNPLPQRTLADCHERMGHSDQAAEARAVLAATLFRRGDAGRARTELGRALQLDPRNQTAQRLLEQMQSPR